LLFGAGAWAEDPKRGDSTPDEQVEPFYGSFNKSIPIDLPGFHGLSPRLRLSYRSSRGNSDLSVGWRLGGVSTIEAAAPRRGTPNYDSNDIFILDGRELVDCTGGMTSPSCTTGGTHATKIESYLRISLDSANNLWEVWDRRGIKTTYQAVLGSNTQSFSGTFRWAISEVTDTHGNTVTYAHWTGTNRTYLDQVSYNGTTVQLYWEQRPDVKSFASGDSGSSADLMELAHRLKTIDIQTGGQRVRSYALGFGAASGGSGRSLLRSLQVFGKDATVDASGNVSGPSSLPEVTFDYHDDPADFAAKATWSTNHSTVTYKSDQVSYWSAPLEWSSSNVSA
jgi:hypothetical protein